MKSITLHALRRLPVAALVIFGGLALAPDGMQAQRRVGGTGYGSSVKTLFFTTKSPVHAPRRRRIRGRRDAGVRRCQHG